MSKTQLKIWLSGILLLICQSSFALSLGEMKVISTFAQPFLAEISIPSYTEDEMASIEIHMASKKKFAERELEMLPIFSQFRFSVEERKDGTLYIKVSTRKSVKELSMSFLLEITWQGGRIIKSYDVLLTPEAVTQIWENRDIKTVAQMDLEEAPQQLKATQTSIDAAYNLAKNKLAISKRAKKKSNKPVIQHATHVAAAQDPGSTKNRNIKRTKNGGLEYTQVGRGDSLSIIAQRIRPNTDMSINQVMVALYKQNRHAFQNNDINRLLAGATLTIDDINTITSISKREASQLAYKYIHGKDSAKPETMMANNDINGANLNTTAMKPRKNRLEISSSNEEEIPPDIMQQIIDEQIAKSGKALNSAHTQITSLKEENEKLKERIASLQTELDATTENLYLATIRSKTIKGDLDLTSHTQQGQNLLVANTNVTMDGDEKLSLTQRIEKYQTAISISSATLLSMSLLGFRKKDLILDIIHNVKARLNKTKDNDDKMFG
jgi:pilus assembly protein FimV